MRNQSDAPSATLVGARISLVSEHSQGLAAIEEHLLERGAAVERVPFAALARPGAQLADAVVVHLVSARGAPGQGAEARRERELVEALAREQRVIALLDDPSAPPVPGLIDFVLPPFHPAEVAARLQRALLKPRSTSVRWVGNLEVSFANRTVLVEGRAADVTFQEFELLRVLLEANGRVLTREDLARALGHVDPAAVSRRVDIHVHRLRSKLAGLTGARIETVRNVGYRLAVSAS